MKLNDLIGEFKHSGKEVPSLTNDKYKRLCEEEVNPAIDKIIQEHMEAWADADNIYFVG